MNGQSTDLFISVNPETNMLVDSLGRERIFHGTNVVVKHKPFHPELEGFDDHSFSETDMKLLQSLGLNTIRLGENSFCENHVFKQSSVKLVYQHYEIFLVQVNSLSFS